MIRTAAQVPAQVTAAVQQDDTHKPNRDAQPFELTGADPEDTTKAERKQRHGRDDHGGDARRYVLVLGDGYRAIAHRQQQQANQGGVKQGTQRR